MGGLDTCAKMRVRGRAPYPVRVPALLSERFAADARASVWACTESPDALGEALPPAWRHPQPPHEARRRETLGARRALLELDPSLAALTLCRDPAGKPSLRERPDLHCSLSHSHGHAAALLSRRACGVDLQLRVPKILGLRSKFERADERAFVEAADDEVAALHVVFGAKEALYKLWGARGIDWRDHLVVHPFAPHSPTRAGATTGEVRRGGHALLADLYWRWVGDFCLVVALQAEGAPRATSLTST